MVLHRRTLCVLLTLLVVASGAFGERTPTVTEVRTLLREAAMLIREIEEAQQSSAALNISGQQVLAGDLEGALETVRAVKRSQNSTANYDYYCIVSSLVSKRQWRAAMELIRDLPDDDSKAMHYSGLAGSLAANQDFEHALKVAREIKTIKTVRLIPNAHYQFADALAEISDYQFKAGDSASAAITLQEAIETVEREEGSTIEAALWYAGRIRLLKSVETTVGPSDVLARLAAAIAAQRNSEFQDGYDELLQHLALTEALVGDFTAAVRATGQIADREKRNAALLTVATEQVRQGDPVGARQLFDSLPSAVRSSSAIGEFARELADSGDSATTVELIKKIESPNDRAYAFADLAFQQAGEDDGVTTLSDIYAMEAAQKAGDKVDPFVFELLAVARTRLGDFPGALQILSQLRDEHVVWPIWNLTGYLTAAGKTEDALALARTQEHPHARAYALLGVASTMLNQIEAERGSRQ